MENLTRRDWLLSYGLAVLAGLFLVLTVNFWGILERVFPRKDETTIHVRGEATSTEDSDLATIYFEISRDLAESQQSALKEVSTKYERFQAFVKSSGAGTIKGSTPTMSSDVVMIGSKKAFQYKATQEFTLQVSDLSKVNEILRKAAEFEISYVGSLQFGLSDEKKAATKQKLFEPALADALEKAKVQAKESGLKLKSNSPKFAKIDDGVLAPEPDVEVVVASSEHDAHSDASTSDDPPLDDPQPSAEQKKKMHFRIKLKFAAE